MITGKELVEKMYSENYDEYEDTRLYSTGDDYLDELLERAFCEGYSYAQKEFGNKENKAAKREWMLKQAKEAGFETEPNYYASGVAVTDKKGREVSRSYITSGWPFKQDDEERYTKQGLNVRKLTAEEMAKKNKELKKETQDKALQNIRERTNKDGFRSVSDYFDNRGPVDKLAVKQELKGGKYSVSRDTETGYTTSVGKYEMPVSKEKDLDPIQEIWDKHNKKEGTHFEEQEGFKAQRQEELRRYKEKRRRKMEQAQSQDPKQEIPKPKQETPEAKVKKANLLKKVGNIYTGKSKYGKKGQAIAIGGTLGTAALVGGGIALHKARKKKKAKKEKDDNSEK